MGRSGNYPSPRLSLSFGGWTLPTDVFREKDITLIMHLGTFHRWGLRAKAVVAREVLLGLVSVRMSPIAYHLDYYAFPPVILACLWLSSREMIWPIVLVGYVAGLVGWTLAEYLLHRFVLHGWPYFSALHQAHHNEPRAMIASPTLFSILFFALSAFLPMWALAGEGPALAWFGGFLSGYIAYGAVHEAVHHAESQGSLLRHFKKLHAIHHHGTTDRNFGVTTGFWDHVFGTYQGNVTRSRGKRR